MSIKDSLIDEMFEEDLDVESVKGFAESMFEQKVINVCDYMEINDAIKRYELWKKSSSFLN